VSIFFRGMLRRLLLLGLLGPARAVTTTVYSTTPSAITFYGCASAGKVVEFPAINLSTVLTITYVCDGCTNTSTNTLIQVKTSDAPNAEAVCVIPTWTYVNCTSWTVIPYCTTNTSAVLSVDKFRTLSTGPVALIAGVSAAVAQSPSTYTGGGSNTSLYYLFFLLLLVPILLCCFFLWYRQRKGKAVAGEKKEADTQVAAGVAREYPWIVPEGSKLYPGPGTWLPPDDLQVPPPTPALSPAVYPYSPAPSQAAGSLGGYPGQSPRVAELSAVPPYNGRSQVEVAAGYSPGYSPTQQR